MAMKLRKKKRRKKNEYKKIKIKIMIYKIKNHYFIKRKLFNYLTFLKKLLN